MAIRNPVEWVAGNLGTTATGFTAAGRAIHPADEAGSHSPPVVRKIDTADVLEALAAGFRDFAAQRTDVLFIGVIYPLAGLLIARVMAGYDMLPLIFPLVAGFALLGPVAAAGLYEMSRRRELGEDSGWMDAFHVFGAPSIGAIIALGLVLAVIFLLWMMAAMGIYSMTLGPEMPTSVSGFASDVLTTGPGWIMIAAGIGAGFLFALLTLTISVVSFPLLVDRKVGVLTAVRTSVRAMTVNPVPMLFWGAIVAGSLALGALPLLLGLIVVIPVLGHATWHLYRRVVA